MKSALGEVILSEAERAALIRVTRMGTAEQRDVLRARIVLLAVGHADLEVAKQLQVNRHTVR
ncbi:MAG: hypothetical protein ACRD63_07370, partial [Pyrinomonadaceae bacterium]